MFKVNDVIIYGAQGVCEIVDMEEKSIGGAKKKYFVLKPVNDKGSTIFAPTDNETALKKMRRLLSKEELVSLIDSMPEEQLVWIANENERFFKDAEQILYNEFQYVLGLSSRNDLTTYIFDRIEKNDKQNRSG